LSPTPPSRPTPWQTADRGADRLVAASWLAVVGLALLLLRPPAAPAPQPETAPPAETVVAAAAPAGPDFYPWVRPGTVRPVEPTGSAASTAPVWAPPERPRDGGFYTKLASPLGDAIFNASNHGNADSFYGGDWVPENIASRAGGAFLEVRRLAGAALPYSAAEMQSRKKYSYGRYEAIIQPASGSGLVTAFFTYTGPWFGDPHDEIDIEFLGKDLTKVHFNYFRNGKSIQPATFDLPFDAGEAPHLYAFDWRPDGITWYIDGVPFYATVPDDPAIPVSAGKVMFSAWTGKPSMAGWHGQATFRDGSGAQFNCVSFTPMGHDTPRCSDTYVKPAARLSAQPVR
jgi:hypothetical protein